MVQQTREQKQAATQYGQRHGKDQYTHADLLK